MTKLSPLTRTYLDHLDAINAGWNALNADIPLVLRAVADHLAGQGEPVHLGTGGIERRWAAPTAGLPFTLRLMWSPADPLRPALTLNETAGHNEVPEPLRHLLDEALLAQWRADLPAVATDALLEDPVQTLLSAWGQGTAAVEQARASQDLAERLAGYALLTAVSNRLGGCSEDLAARSGQLARRPGDVLAEPGWPAYVQVDWIQGGLQYAWDLVYVPQEQRLWLVLYDGRNLGVDLPLATPVRYQDRFPVLADFSHLLGTADPAGSAQEITAAWLARMSELSATASEA